MNKTERKFNFKTLLMFLTVLVLTLSSVFATACTKGGNQSTSESVSTSTSSSSSSSEEEALVDTQTFANGDFEHPTNKKPNTSPISMTSSSTKWTVGVGGEVGFQVSSSNVKRGIVDTASAVYDKLGADYRETKDEAQADGTTKKVTAYNPGTPATEDDAETEPNEAGTRVLMLRNVDFAAQYAVSSTSLAVPSGEYGKLTVWVNTWSIENRNGKAGAYISVKNTVTNPDEEASVYDPLVIENIITAEHEWVAYTIYLKPNQFKNTSFTLEVGLGEGNKYDAENHVKGYAFFDNISFELISKGDYEAATVDTEVAVTTDSDDNYTLEGRIDAVNKTVKYDLSETFDVASSTGFDILDGAGAYNAVNPNKPTHEVAEGTVTLPSATADDLKIDFSALTTGSSYTYTSKELTLKANSYLRISFWAKIEAKDYQTKATMAIYDVAKDSDAIIFANVSTDGYENELTDGFARYTFYVANNFAEDMTYQLKLSFGPTDINAVTDVFTLPIGTAHFKAFESEYITKENYDIVNVSSDTRAKKGSLIGSYDSDFVEPDDEEEEDETSDSYNVSVAGPSKVKLENGEIVSVNEITTPNLAPSAISEGSIIGVVNSKHVDKYDNDLLNGALTFTEGRAVEHTDNEHVQAIAVYSASGEHYVSGRSLVTIPQNSTYVFSVRVYAHASAQAFVRLVTVNPDSSKDALPAYSTVVTNEVSSAFNDGFATVTFIVTTGFESYDVRLQFGVSGDNQVALFQSVNVGSSNGSYTSADAVKNVFNPDDYAFTDTASEAVKTYYFASEDHAGDMSLALKAEDGSVRCDTGDVTVKSTHATLVKDGLSDAAKAVKLVIYNRLNLNDRYTIEAPETEEESVVESESISGEEGTQNYGWLQVTSIIIALVLVVALVAVVIRKSTESKQSKKKRTEKYYQGYDKNKRYTKSSDVAVPDADDNAKDYDYDNPENN